LLGLLDREPSHGYDLRWIDLTAASLDALAEVVGHDAAPSDPRVRVRADPLLPRGQIIPAPEVI